MLFDPSNMNIHVLRSLIRKLTEKYSHAIRDDRPLKDVKEIKKAIHYVERKIAEVEEQYAGESTQKFGPRNA
jgi:archaellum component FlaC